MRLAAGLAGVLSPPLCWSCSAPARRHGPLCVRCRVRLHRLGAECVVLGGDGATPAGLRVWAPFAYSGPARDLVRALKFRGASGIADWAAAQIVANAPPGLLAGALVPVPLHPARLRSRGYNQAAVIAAALARRTGLEVADCLVRSGRATTQVGRARPEREAGPAGRIALHPGRAPPHRALLVDDVVTTGATLRACRAALGSETAAVALARTIGR